MRAIKTMIPMAVAAAYAEKAEMKFIPIPSSMFPASRKSAGTAIERMNENAILSKMSSSSLFGKIVY